LESFELKQNLNRLTNHNRAIRPYFSIIGLGRLFPDPASKLRLKETQ